MEVAAAVAVAEARGMIVVSVVAVEEVGWVLITWAVMVALMGAAEEVEAQDLLVGWFEVVEVVVAVMREMMRHWVVDLGAVEHVGWKALHSWVLREVEVRVRVVAEEVVQLESAKEC